MAHRVTLIPSDGIGPDLTEATRRVLEATYDMKPSRDVPTAVGTSEVGTSEVAVTIIEKLEVQS